MEDRKEQELRKSSQQPMEFTEEQKKILQEKFEFMQQGKSWNDLQGEYDKRALDLKRLKEKRNKKNKAQKQSRKKNR